MYRGETAEGKVVMDRNLSQRIRNVEKLLSKAEEIVSAARRKDEEWLAYWVEISRPKALLHATAVAAIVISRKPKIDEPLIRAWVRTLRHYGITVKNEYGREYQYETGHEHEYRFESDYERELKAAHSILYPAIMNGANETEKFTEIFRTAPAWLLEFTHMEVDAMLLKFDLPEMSEKQIWDEESFKNSRWPLLPLGMMMGSVPRRGVSRRSKPRAREP
jgi:hypothetical protein